MQSDPILGDKIHNLLKSQGIETPINTDWIDLKLCRPTDPDRLKYVREVIEEAQTQIMNALGLDLIDDSLRETPRRVAKMMCEEIFTGLDYDNFPKCSTFENRAGYDEMLATSCTVKSSCEHHFLAILGTAWVAYLPNHKILGLSKFNRVVDFFSRRPQVQERLTIQIYAALSYILGTEDVAVVMKAKHLCTQFRGVEDTQSETISSKLGGRFMTVPALRQEFLALTKQPG